VNTSDHNPLPNRADAVLIGAIQRLRSRLASRPRPVTVPLDQVVIRLLQGDAKAVPLRLEIDGKDRILEPLRPGETDSLLDHVTRQLNPRLVRRLYVYGSTESLKAIEDVERDFRQECTWLSEPPIRARLVEGKKISDLPAGWRTSRTWADELPVAEVLTPMAVPAGHVRAFRLSKPPTDRINATGAVWLFLTDGATAPHLIDGVRFVILWRWSEAEGRWSPTAVGKESLHGSD
jgi:hypothetical protein